MASALLRGFVVGVLVAAPVGPMALLAIRRTLDRGWSSGIASGLGIATADGAYAALAALGLGAASSLLLALARAIQVVGGLVIVFLGVRGLLARPAATAAEAPAPLGLLGAYTSCLGLTLANPPTILSFAALMAGVGLVTSTREAAAALVLGVLLGSAAWWLVLTGAVARGRRWVGERWRQRLTRGAGGALALLGLAVLVAALRG